MFTKSITTSKKAFVFPLTVLTLAFVAFPAVADAQQAPAQTESKSTQTNQKPAAQPAPAKQEAKPAQATTQQRTTSYIYVAQPSDTYSELARKAVQTYGKKYKVNLSLAQILYAETNLTQAAGSPYLQQGQTVTIQEADVKNWIDKARQLNAGAIALWNAYVPGVDFNTDTNGQK